MTRLIDPADLDAAADLVRRAERIAIVTHVSPDPDAYGSLLGFGLALKSLGKRVALLCDDPAPSEVHFLLGSTDVRGWLPEDFAPDLLIGVDASDAERLGRVWDSLSAKSLPILVIDHHVTNPQFGLVNLVDPAWASTAEGVVGLIDRLEIPVTPGIAECLLAGVVGDTRGFSTPSTTPTSLAVAARLMAAGANIARVSEMILNRRSLETLRVWGIGLANIQFDSGLIWTIVPLTEGQPGARNGSSASGLSTLLISAAEAIVAAVFTEQPGGSVDVSFRARPGYDVATVAVQLGGGGHALAAGTTMPGPLAETVEKAVALLRQSVQAGSST